MAWASKEELAWQTDIFRPLQIEEPKGEQSTGHVVVHEPEQLIAQLLLRGSPVIVIVLAHEVVHAVPVPLHEPLLQEDPDPQA